MDPRIPVIMSGMDGERVAEQMSEWSISKHRRSPAKRASVSRVSFFPVCCIQCVVPVLGEGSGGSGKACIWRPGVNLRHHPLCFLRQGLTWSLPGLLAGCSVSPRGPPLSTSPPLGVPEYPMMPGFLLGFLGMELKSSWQTLYNGVTSQS